MGNSFAGDRVGDLFGVVFCAVAAEVADGSELWESMAGDVAADWDAAGMAVGVADRDGWMRGGGDRMGTRRRRVATGY